MCSEKSLNNRILYFPSNNHGIVLILTLTIIALLVTVTFELNRQIRGSVMDSAVIRDRLILSQMITSGIEVAEAILIKDKTNTVVDSVQEDWANPDKRLC
jgi:general secretion pathway protein K